MPEPIKSLLYVDEGDTCTAKMAVQIATQYAKEKHLDLSFGSAGVFAIEGTPMDPLAVRALREAFGIEVSGELSRPLTPALFRQYDRVTSMLYRLNIFVNDKAHAWPNAGNFAIVKPTGKPYAAYLACAQALSRNITAQLDKFIENKNVLCQTL